jgi:hypothetical protein
MGHGGLRDGVSIPFFWVRFVAMLCIYLADLCNVLHGVFTLLAHHGVDICRGIIKDNM